jgi:predicted transcriptional regulator
VPTTSTLLLAFAGWGVGGLSLLVNALFGKRMGANAALGIGLAASAAWAAIAVAPAAFAVLLVLYGLGGMMISASAIFQALLARHPLEPAAAGARQDQVQTWSSVGRAWLPLAVAGSVFALFGWRGAAAALGAMTAALTVATWVALRGGLAPPAAVGSAWRQARDSVVAAAKRAWRAPVRFVVSVPLLGFLIGFPIGWMLGAVSPMLKVHMPWLAAEYVVWAAAVVTFVHRYAAVWANGWWAAAKATRPWMATLAGASLPMVTVPLLVGALLAWPHLATSAVPLVGMFVAVSIAFQLPMGPTTALTRGVAGTSRFLVGTQLGAATGVGLTQLVVAGLAPGGLTAATAGAVELTLGVGYAMVTAAMIVIARLVTRFKVGSIAQLEAAIAGLVEGPGAKAKAAEIMAALEQHGILNIGDLIRQTPGALRALGLTGEQVVLIERGLAELGHSLRGPPPSGGGGPARLSHQAVSGDLGPSIARSPARERVSADDLVALGERVGLPRREFVTAGLPELDAHDGLNHNVRADTGVDDLVLYAGADGRLHTDTRTLAVLRVLAVTRPEVVRRLLAHELAHLRNPHATEDQVQALAPLPRNWPVALRTVVTQGWSLHDLVTAIGAHARRLDRGITIDELAEATGVRKPALYGQVDRLVGWGVVVHDGLTPRRHVLHPDFARLLAQLDDLDELAATGDPEYVDALTAFAARLATSTDLNSGRRALDVKASLDRLRRIPASPIHELPYPDTANHSIYTWHDLLVELAGVAALPSLRQLTWTQLSRVHSVDYDALSMGLAVLRSLGLTDPGIQRGSQLIHWPRPEALALRDNPALSGALSAVPLRLDEPIAPIVAAFRRLGVAPVRSYTVGDLLNLFRDEPRSVAELRAGFPSPDPTLRLWLNRLVDWGVLVVADKGRPMRYALATHTVTWLRDGRALRDIADRRYRDALVVFTNLLDTLSPRDQSEIRALADVVARLHRLTAPVTAHTLLSLLSTRATIGQLQAATGLDERTLLARLSQLQGLSLVSYEPTAVYRLSPLGAELLSEISDPTAAGLTADAGEIEIAQYRGLLINLGLMLDTTSDLGGIETYTAIRYLLTKLWSIRGSPLAAVAHTGVPGRRLGRAEPGRGGDGAAIWRGFWPGEEPVLNAALREALAGGHATPVNPAELPESPRAPSTAGVVQVPGSFLRARGLGRVVDRLGAYTLHLPDRSVIVFTDEMFARLRDAGQLDAILWIEIEDRVWGLHGEAAHQRRADAVMDRLPGAVMDAPTPGPAQFARAGGLSGARAAEPGAAGRLRTMVSAWGERGPTAVARLVRGALVATAAVVALVGLAPTATASTGTTETTVITVEPRDNVGTLGGSAEGVVVPAGESRPEAPAPPDNTDRPENTAPSEHPASPDATASPSAGATESPTARDADRPGRRWVQWLGGGLGATALVALWRRWAAAKRERAWAVRIRGWDGAATPWELTGETRVLQRALQLLPDAGDPGVPLRDLRHGGDRLVDMGLFRIERGPEGQVLVPIEVFAQLWARAPPELRAAMRRNLPKVLADAKLAQRSPAELGRAVLGALREGIWDRAEVHPRMRDRARWIRGGRAGLRSLFDDVRPVSRDIDRLVSSAGRTRRLLEVATRLEAAERGRAAAQQLALNPGIWRRQWAAAGAWLAQRHAGLTIRWLSHRLPAELRGLPATQVRVDLENRLQEVKDQIDAKQESEQTAVLAASNAAALAGYVRRDVELARERAVLGWARSHMASLAGLIQAFAGQVGNAASLASTDLAAHVDRSAAWVTGQAATARTGAAVTSLSASLLGDRLIKNMGPAVFIGAVGSAALLLLGMVPIATFFLPAMVAVSAMGTAAGLARGRMDRYHPVPAELKDARQNRRETAARVGGFVLPLAIVQGIDLAGVQVTMVALSVLAAALTAGLWLLLRGEGRNANPRAPLSVWSSVVGAVRQIVGTPNGLLRAVLSIHLVTVLTGLYSSALGGQMIDQLVLLNDPAHRAFASTATAMTVLLTVRGLTTIVTGPQYKRWLKPLLGKPGAIAHALGRNVQPGPMDEARLLRGVTLLAAVQLVPAVWLAMAPGLLPLGLLLTTSGVVAAWARMPLNPWVEGATGQTLSDTAKAASVAIGGAISAVVLGGYSALVTQRVDAGQPYGDVVATGNLRLALMAIAVVVVTAVLTHFVAKLRISTLDGLRARLEAAGADAETAKQITDVLASRGINDVGSARALFLSEDWAPRWGAGRRLAARASRFSSVVLDNEGKLALKEGEQALLIAALRSFDRPSGSDNGTGRRDRLRQAASRAIAWLGRFAPLARTVSLQGTEVLRGRALIEWARNVANAWYGLRPPWRVAAVLIVGFALAVLMGPGAAAMAAAIVPGPPGGGDDKPAVRRGVLIAESDHGLVVITDPAAVAPVLQRVRELRQRGRVSQGDTSRLSPGGLWNAACFWLYLADGLDAVDGLAVPGLRQVRVLYVLEVDRSAVIVPTTMFDAVISRFDARTTAALEHEIVRGLYGAAPEDGWRPVATDAGPVDRPGTSAPASLPAVEYVDTLASKLGRPTALLVRPRGRDAGLLVVHPRDSYDLDRTLETAAAYRVLGAPAVPTWPAVVAEDVLDGNRNVVLRAGERVEVGNYRGDSQVDLADLAQRVQVARLHAAAAALGDTDVRAVKEANLVRDRAGNVGLVDFDQGMTIDRIPVEFHVQIDIEAAPAETRDARNVFGLLTEADLLAGYQHVVERRAELMAVIRDPVRRLMVGARLDWMSQVVEAGRLPGWLRAQLETAQRAAAAAYPGAERLPDHAYRLGFGPEQTRLISSALARMRQEQRPAPRGTAGGNRDPPAVALRGDEVPFVFDSERLLAELRTRVSERAAADLVERLVTFAWWDTEVLVIALSEDRLVELDRLGAVGPAIDGARRRAS